MMGNNWELSSGVFLLGLGLIFVLGYLLDEVPKEFLNMSFILLVLGLAALSVGLYRQLKAP